MKTMETKGITKAQTLTSIRIIISKYTNINYKPYITTNKPIHQPLQIIIAYLCKKRKIIIIITSKPTSNINQVQTS